MPPYLLFFLFLSLCLKKIGKRKKGKGQYKVDSFYSLIQITLEIDIICIFIKLRKYAICNETQFDISTKIFRRYFAWTILGVSLFLLLSYLWTFSFFFEWNFCKSIQFEMNNKSTIFCTVRREKWKRQLSFCNSL